MSKETNNTNRMDAFASMSVPKAVLKNTIPAMLTMLMSVVYNLADMFFIGQTHDAYQVAAVSLATPVFLIFMALGTIFGAGGTAVISRSMGEGKKVYAKHVSAFCMWSCVGLGVIVAALFLIFMNPILTLVGASANTWEYAKTYLTIMILCGPFVMISNCFSNILRAEGQSTKATVGMITGNFINLVLDPIMILGFGWNIVGAAIASVIGNVVGAVYYLFYFKRPDSETILSIKMKDFKATNKILTGVLSIGIPAALGSFLMSVSQIIMNNLMAVYGDLAVAGLGVAAKVTMITGMICIGLGQGVQPLLGFQIGAKNGKRFKEIMKFSLIFALALSVVLTLICYLFTGPIVSAFLSNPEAYDYAVTFTRILLCTSCLFGVYYVVTNAMQAMGAALSALVINLSRQGIVYIPALFILNAVMGYTGIVWAQPVADITSTVFAMILYVIAYKKVSKKILQKRYETDYSISY